WVNVPLQPCVTRWLPAKSQTRVQPLVIGSPRLVTVRLAVKPVFHWLTVYVIRQPAAALAWVATATPSPVTRAAAVATAAPRTRVRLAVGEGRAFIPDCSSGDEID